MENMDPSVGEYFKLKNYGHVLASNLHADTYDQAFDQICGDNKVLEQEFLNKLNRKYPSKKGVDFIDIIGTPRNQIPTMMIFKLFNGKMNHFII